MLQIAPEERALLLQVLRDALGEPPPAVYVIGSRARGTARRGSDLDLFIDADSPAALSWEARARMAERLDESDLPYTVDIVDGSAVNTSTRTRMLRHAHRLL